MSCSDSSVNLQVQGGKITAALVIHGHADGFHSHQVKAWLVDGEFQLSFGPALGVQVQALAGFDYYSLVQLGDYGLVGLAFLDHETMNQDILVGTLALVMAHRPPQGD